MSIKYQIFIGSPVYNINLGSVEFVEPDYVDQGYVE